MRIFICLIAVALDIGALNAQQSPFFSRVGNQQPAQMTCAADGTVVNAVTGEPIVRAHVSSMGSSAAASTDAQGRWNLSGIACGNGNFMAQKAGFIQGMYGQSRNTVPAKPVTLQDGSPAHDLKIALTPQSVVTGTVIDENGDPVMNAQVQVITSVVQEGKRVWQPRNSGQTNDLGQYRIYGLNPGKYVICAQGNGFNLPVARRTQTNTYTESCYPGPVDSATVSAVELPGGRENKIDFTLTPKVGITLKGSIYGLPANSGAGLMLRKHGLMNGMGGRAANTRVNPDGTFAMEGVAPGSYILQANVFAQQHRMVGETPVEVGTSDIEGITVTLATGFEVTGTVKTETTKPAGSGATFGGTPSGVLGATVMPNGAVMGGIVGSLPSAAPVGPMTMGPVNLFLRSADGAFGAGQMKWSEDKTSFAMSDVMASRYTLQVNAKAGYFVKSATLNGQDLLGQEFSLTQATGPVEIVISDDPGTIDGTLTAADGTPGTGQVILLSDTSTALRPSMGFAGNQGTFKMQSVPPGNYTAYSWSDFTQAEYGNPEWMRQFGTGGVRVAVTAGQTAKVELKQVVVP